MQPTGELVGKSRAGNWLWLIATFAVLPLAVLAVGNYHRRTAGLAEVREATERLVAATARGDQEALAGDPLLRGHPEMVARLIRHRPALSGRCRVTASRNGVGGHQLQSPETVSHLGYVSTPAGVLLLGFWYDRETGRVEFVTASFQ